MKKKIFETVKQIKKKEKQNTKFEKKIFETVRQKKNQKFLTPKGKNH